MTLQDALIRQARRLSSYECGKFAQGNGFHLSDSFVLLSDPSGFKDFYQGMQDQQAAQAAEFERTI